MDANTPGVVLVGVDGSKESRAALRFALEEGLRRGVGVEVVTGWSWNPPYNEFDVLMTRDEVRDEARAMQDRTVRTVMAEMPATPPVSQVVRQGHGGKVLLESVQRAAVLVVGHTTRGVLARALLGSVSEHCVRHSPVPVIVVPSPAMTEREQHAEQQIEIHGPVGATTNR